MLWWTLFSPTRRGLVGNVKLKGCSDHEMVESKMLGAMRREHCKFTTMDFRIADLACSGVCFLECHGIKP